MNGRRIKYNMNFKSQKEFTEKYCSIFENVNMMQYKNVFVLEDCKGCIYSRDG